MQNNTNTEDILKVLLVGDVVGKPGRVACKSIIPFLKKNESIDFVIANGENIAGGSGINQRTIEELFSSGIDVVTTGDHAFKRKESYSLLKSNNAILRPANYPSDTPGVGSAIYSINDCKVGVINLLGRVFLKPIDCPFRKAKEIIEKFKQETSIIIIDFHAEATSEKIALSWSLDGEVSLICGTHTHVQTADETIRDKGTAYITDVGMTGPFKSVIGRDFNSVINSFYTLMPNHFKVATEDVRLNGIIVEINKKSGAAISIKRIQKSII